MDTTLLFVLFFSHVINKPEPFRKRHSSLFTLHIPAVIIINRTIPNIKTNSQVYYKERKEEFEIFLCGSSVNQYIDCYVLFFFKRNSSCHRLLPTFGNHIKIIERFIHFCRLGTRIVPVEQVFCVTPQKLPLTASFFPIIQMGYRSAITNTANRISWILLAESGTCRILSLSKNVLLPLCQQCSFPVHRAIHSHQSCSPFWHSVCRSWIPV